MTGILGLAIDALVAAGGVAYLVEGTTAPEGPPGGTILTSTVKPAGPSSTQAGQAIRPTIRANRPARPGRSAQTRPAATGAINVPPAPPARTGQPAAQSEHRSPAILPALVLFIALAGHATLTVLALAAGGLNRIVLFGRLAAGCWVIIGGLAVLLGAHFWPACMTADQNRLVVLAACCLVALGGVLGYLGGLEWLAQRSGD